jgi:hypothetical protein
MNKKKLNKIIILFIVIVFIIYNFNKSRLTSTEKKAGLILFMGESFRNGSHGTRTKGTIESYPAQIKACKSHIKFLEHLKTKINVDVCISTYNTPFNNDLIEIYKPYLIKNIFYDEPIALTESCKKIIRSINTDKYDFIFYIRIDLDLKDYFIDTFNPYADKILFPFVCWYKDSKTRDGHPRIADTMMFIPRKYFKTIKDISLTYHDEREVAIKQGINLSFNYHDTWELLIKFGLTYDDMDVMINGYYDSDPENDYNPFYSIANRPAVEFWDSPGKTFDKYNF